MEQENIKELEKQKAELVNKYKFFKNILDEPAKGERRIYAQKALDNINKQGSALNEKIKSLKR